MRPAPAPSSYCCRLEHGLRRWHYKVILDTLYQIVPDHPAQLQCKWILARTSKTASCTGNRIASTANGRSSRAGEENKLRMRRLHRHVTLLLARSALSSACREKVVDHLVSERSLGGHIRLYVGWVDRADEGGKASGSTGLPGRGQACCRAWQLSARNGNEDAVRTLELAQPTLARPQQLLAVRLSLTSRQAEGAGPRPLISCPHALEPP